MALESLPPVVQQRIEARATVRQAQRDGQRVGVVMTMGALHEGHLSLVDASAAECDKTVVTIFVNPTQFGPQEDYDKYPRDLSADCKALRGRSVSFVFAPDRREMYGDRHTTVVRAPDVANRLEGQHRPGHYDGVATIVLKLLQVIPADVAYFGQKDYQQFAVIRQMAQDLDVETTIRVCPTVRDGDGLALSSRNRYLSPAERARALSLHRALELAKDRISDGERDAENIKTAMHEVLTTAKIDRIDYIELADADTLAPIPVISDRAVALIAAQVGSTRLIDNCILDTSAFGT